MAASRRLMRAFFVVVIALYVGQVDAHPDPHPKSLFPVGRRVRVLLASGVTLAPNTTQLTRNGEAVEVAVAGVAAPLANDLVALYAPPSMRPSDTVPLAWRRIAASNPGYLTRGAGRVVFPVANHRADVVFRLVRNGTVLPGEGAGIVVEGESPVVRNMIAAQPTQGSLGLDAQGRTVVQWVSGSNAAQQAQWGTSPGALAHSAPSTAITYTAKQMCGVPANSTGWLDPGWLHRATLSSPLPAGPRIYYRFGSDTTGWSSVFSFNAPPPAGGRTRFLAFQDVGMTQPVLFNNVCPPYCPPGLHFSETYGINSTKLVPHLAKEDADVALLMGDVSYAQGYASDWDVFGIQFEPAFTRWPLLVAQGNHERDFPFSGDAFDNESSDSGGECGVPLVYRYTTPAPYPSLDPRRSYYSFNVGCVHFLVLDSETPSNEGSPQHAFVAADLAAVDRGVTPFIVVGFHRMMAAPSVDKRPVVGDQANMARLTRDYEDLFFKSKVSLVIVGHEHAYSRSCPLYKGRCTPGGITHVLAGNAGAGFTYNFPRHPDGSYDFPSWIVYGVEGVNGFVRVTAEGGRMVVEAVGTDDGKVFDSTVIALPSAAAPAGKADRNTRGSTAGSDLQGWLKAAWSRLPSLPSVSFIRK